MPRSAPTPHDPAVRSATLSAPDYRLLIETVRDYAIFLLDPEGHVATWNAGAERIKGYTAAEIIGQHFTKFYTAEDLATGKPERGLQTARDTGRFEDEGWRVRKGGTRFWANVAISAIHDAQGTLIGFTKVTRDLSDKKLAEETARQLIREQAERAAAEQVEARLREEGDRYRALSRRLEVILESVADGITVQDRAGNLMFANTAAARSCGYGSVGELLAAKPAEIMARFEMRDEHGGPLEPELLPGRRAMRNGEPSSLLMRHKNHVTGREVWVHLRASAVLGSDGLPELAVNVWHDVTDDRRREQHERFLAKSTQALSSSLDFASMVSTFAGLLVPDLADWCSIHLLDQDELLNVAVAHTEPSKVALAREYQSKYPPLRDPVHGAWGVVQTGRSQLYDVITDELIERGARDADQLLFLRSLGLKSLLLAPIRIRDHVAGVITLASTQDDRYYDERDVALAEELGRRAGVGIENAKLFMGAQAAAARAEEASRIKDEFLATVSHELRTPLNAMMGWSFLLREQSADPAVLKAAEVIHRNAQAQAKIIEDILDVSRIVSGNLRLELEPNDVVTTIRNAIEVVGPSATAKRIVIAFEPPQPKLSFVADHQRLQQIVWNLLSNAVKFSDAGSSIRVEMQAQPSSLLLSVTDSGRGIDPEFLPHVFERFKQADSSSTRRVGGLGLGLAIVRHLVELHGGQVQAFSEGVGRGSRFTLSLPTHELPAPASTRPPAPDEKTSDAAHVPATTLHGLRVLVVEDEPDTRDFVHTILSGAGAQVTLAGSASEAFELVQSTRPQLLVSDLGMPEEDGYSLMRRVRGLGATRGGDVPSIALTAYTRALDRTRALAVGFTTHIGKPVDPAELLAAVANLSRFSHYTDPG